jgi:hypothetical protein
MQLALSITIILNTVLLSSISAKCAILPIPHDQTNSAGTGTSGKRYRIGTTGHSHATAPAAGVCAAVASVAAAAGTTIATATIANTATTTATAATQ